MKCSICHGLGYVPVRDEHGREVWQRCKCHPAPAAQSEPKKKKPDLAEQPRLIPEEERGEWYH